MMIARAPRGRERFVGDRVVARISRSVPDFPVRADLAVTFQIQTKLETARMKCASPIKRTLSAKVVPLDRDTDLIDIAVKRPPPIFYLTPSVLLGRATRIHLA